MSCFSCFSLKKKIISIAFRLRYTFIFFFLLFAKYKTHNNVKFRVKIICSLFEKLLSGLLAVLQLMRIGKLLFSGIGMEFVLYIDVCTHIPLYLFFFLFNYTGINNGFVKRFVRVHTFNANAFRLEIKSKANFSLKFITKVKTTVTTTLFQFSINFVMEIVFMLLYNIRIYTQTFYCGKD